MSGRDPERVDVESTPLLQGKERRAAYSGAEASADGKLLAAAEEEPDEHVFLPPSPDGHYPFLDMTRICCVWLVAVDHGNATFGEYNMLFGQEWVLQFLFLVCGVCYGMSKRSLISYELRLAQYVVIGIMINWAAWIVMGLDWRNNFFGVVFHFWFVVGIMLYAAILAPLKPHLQKVREAAFGEAPEEEVEAELQQQDRRDQFLRALVLIVGGLLGILVIFTVVLEPIIELSAPPILRLATSVGSSGTFWGLPSDLGQSRDFLRRMSTYFMLTCGNIYLLIVCPRVFKSPGYTPWAVLIYTYGHRLLFYRASDERPFHGLDLMMIGVAVYYLGLQNRRTLGKYLIRYWFVLLFACCLLWPPGVQHRFDEDPPLDLGVRLRVNALEAIFVIAWFAAGERMVQREIFTEDRLDFLNLWALIVFLVHKAVHIVFAPPFNWIVLLAIGPACYYATRKGPAGP